MSHPTGAPYAFTPASSPVNNNFIAVATRRAGSTFRHIELFDLVNNRFTELTRLVSPNSHYLNPFISPDSTRIGYHRCRREPDNQSSPQLLLESVKSLVPGLSLFRFVGEFPAFSPSGDRIAYKGMPEVYVVNRDGSNLRKVSIAKAFLTVWDPVRPGVIYTAMGETFATGTSQVGIVSINVDDEENSVKRLTVERHHVQLVTGWGLDCFSSNRHDPGTANFDLYLIHPNGTRLRKLFGNGSGGRANHPFSEAQWWTLLLF